MAWTGKGLSPLMQAEARSTIETWRRRLLLGEWHVNLQFKDEDAPAEEDGSTTPARCSADPTYMIVAIWIFPEWGRMERHRREHALVHELSHCHTQELRDLLNDARMGRTVSKEETFRASERLTQRIANAVLWKDRS